MTEGGETRTTFKLLGEVSSHRFHSSLYSTAVFNLNCSLVFFFKSFFQYFLEKSTQKHGQSCTAFDASFVHKLPTAFAVAIFFSRCTPRRSQLVTMLGAARTRYAQTSCRLFPRIARLLAVPPNAALSPLATNYFCNGVYRTQWPENADAHFAKSFNAQQ